jgi:hypothetical protein
MADYDDDDPWSSHALAEGHGWLTSTHSQEEHNHIDRVYGAEMAQTWARGFQGQQVMGSRKDETTSATQLKHTVVGLDQLCARVGSCLVLRDTLTENRR